MEPYDPDKRYFGPQGSRLCSIIPEYPIGIPQAQPLFNYAGYSPIRYKVYYQRLRLKTV